MLVFLVALLNAKPAACPLKENKVLLCAAEILPLSLPKKANNNVKMKTMGASFFNIGRFVM